MGSRGSKEAYRIKVEHESKIALVSEAERGDDRPMQFLYNYQERSMALHAPILKEKNKKHTESPLKLLYL